MRFKQNNKRNYKKKTFAGSIKMTAGIVKINRKCQSDGRNNKNTRDSN